MANIKAHMICHAHWDREWYLTREEFRVKLVRLIDGLLNIIDTVPGYVSFMLDGQTIAIEDYLEIKPENRERLSSVISKGKIICGPWYILPDELLVSGEAHIRNYIIGSKVTDGMSGKMKIAYLPDSFGHPQQMPQIVKGLGMDTMVFWRGTANFMKNTEFYWRSPHAGSETLCIHMPNGYGNSGRLSANMDITTPRLTSMIESLGAKSTTNIVLLMNGSDHISGQTNIADIVNKFNEASATHKIQLSTLDTFVTELKADIPELKTYSGELRYSERSMLLGGTLSTRMPLKQNNHIVQKNMERYLEPVLVWERLMGGNADMRDYSTYLWKKILENHPHDSICGCSVDAVHSEMMTRFQCVKQLELTLLDDAFLRIEKLSHTSQQQADAQIMLFEPTQDRLPSYIELDIDLDMTLVQEVNFEKSIIEDYEPSLVHPVTPTALRIVDDFGREIEYTILSAQKAHYRDYQDETLPEVYKVNRLRAGMLLPEYDCGFHILNVYRADKEQSFNAEISSSKISNEYYEIIFENGAFTVLDKETGRVHTGVNRLIDKGDAGDEYTYSWPQTDGVYSLDTFDIQVQIETMGEICWRLVVEGSLMLPKKLNIDRKNRSSNLIATPVKITVSLYKGIDRIDFKTELENNSEDHRLQAEFPSGICTQASRSGGIFGITERNIALEIPESWAEYPQSTHPTHGFMNLSDGRYGLSAASCGLTEFEAENIDGQSLLRVTLIRCVGWLSRTDLITREGNGGWTIETPDAQCRGKHEFEYSITYHSRDYKQGNSYKLMEKMLHPSALYQMRKSDGNRKFDANPLEFISKLPRNLRLSAVKISESGSGIIVRVYSIGDENATVQLKLPTGIKEAYITNMTEKRLEKLQISANTVNFTVEPAQIVTIEFVY